MFELLLIAKKKTNVFTGGYALVAGGSVSGSSSYSTEKISYSTNSRIVGTALITAGSHWCGIGNQDAAYFSRDIGGNRYSYSNDVVSSSAKMTSYRSEYSSISKDTLGLFFGGSQGTPITTASETTYDLMTSAQYTYSSDVFSNGKNLFTPSKLTAAAGNLEYGLITGGNRTYTQNFYPRNNLNITLSTDVRYYYSSSSFTSSTNTSFKRHAAAACSGSDSAIFIGGILHSDPDQYGQYTVSYLSSVAKYVYSSQTVLTAMSLSTNRNSAGAAANNTIGILSGGIIGSSSSTGLTSLYAFPTNVWTTGQALLNLRRYHASVSSSPGWA